MKERVIKSTLTRDTVHRIFLLTCTARLTLSPDQLVVVVHSPGVAPERVGVLHRTLVMSHVLVDKREVAGGALHSPGGQEN